jgi:S1-C subfamily serine protease
MNVQIGKNLLIFAVVVFFSAILVGMGYVIYSVKVMEDTLISFEETLNTLDSRLEREEITLVSLQKDGYVEKPGLANAAKDVLPAVIFILGAEGGDDSSRYNEGGSVVPGEESNGIRGTGFFISSDGYIATAKHVVFNVSQNRVKVKDSTNRMYDAEVVQVSESGDIAILKADVKNHPSVEFGNFENIRIGDEVGFIGFNPGLNQPLLHGGNVSAIGLDENMAKLFTINAFVNRGNSGSPVFSIATGRVIGLVSARQHEQINRDPINLESIPPGISIGGVNPIEFSAKIYNEMLQLAKETTQVGIGFIYSSDEIRKLQPGR